LDHLGSGEPSDGLGLDLIGTGLVHHLVARGRHHQIRIGDRLANMFRQCRFRQSAGCAQNGVLVEFLDRRTDHGLGTEDRRRRYQQCGDVCL
jgi:hypothetical protein